MTASEYDSIRSKLSTEKRRLPMFSSKRFKGSAREALAVLQEVPAMPKLDPAWAWQIFQHGDYEGTTQDESEALDYQSRGYRIKRVPSLYGSRRDVPEELRTIAQKAREALRKANDVLLHA